MPQSKLLQVYTSLLYTTVKTSLLYTAVKTSPSLYFSSLPALKTSLFPLRL